MSQQNQPVNPANKRETKTEARERIPMSLPMQKLSVPDIPGYHLHWMRGDATRINQALRAGYEFVEPEEVSLANFGLADDASQSGNTDMGTRVSIGSGQREDGTEERLYLMKIKEEWWQEDQKKLEDRNEQIAATLRGGHPDAGQNDDSQRYVPEAHRKGVANLFMPKNRR